MKVGDFVNNWTFDVNAIVKIYAGGQWNEHGAGRLAGTVPCGDISGIDKKILHSDITYVTTDPSDCSIVIECDMPIDDTDKGGE